MGAVLADGADGRSAPSALEGDFHALAGHHELLLANALAQSQALMKGRTLKEAEAQLLAMGKKTGCLSVANRQQFGTIHFDRGRISHAAIVNRRDRLGDILVKAGIVDRDALDQAIAAQERHPDQRLGEILVAHGAISREELHRQVRAQIEEAVYHLFTWNEGTFSFEPDIRPEEQDLLVAISPENQNTTRPPT